MRPLTLLCLFFTLLSFAQNGRQAAVSSAAFVETITEESTNRLTDTFTYCDTDSDGLMPVPIREIQNTLLIENSGQLVTAAGIYICTANADVLLITNLPGTAPATATPVCTDMMGGIPMLDIATNNHYEMYVSKGSRIDKINPLTCQSEAIYNLSSGAVTSLSFDRIGNLYVGGYDSSVYRIENNDFNQLHPWHDFGSGHAAGDFVMLGDKMYIAWEDNAYLLFEVTVDSNNNYVSHIVLGNLPAQTYGLASELGTIYGVTPNRLYKINRNPLGFQTRILNVGGNQWFGASGKNEAVDFEVQTFENLADAQSNQHPLPDLWPNTIAGGQTVYVTIRNPLTNQIITIPAHIVVNVAPTYVNPVQLSHCDSDAQAADFNLRATQTAIIGTQTNLTVTFHDNLQDSLSNSNPLPDQVTITGNQKTIFVRVTNDVTGCYANFNFGLGVYPSLVYHDPPDLLVCHSAQSALETVALEDQIPLILNGQTDTEVTFYHSYPDAASAIHALQYPYQMSSMHEEIFVRIENTTSHCFETGSFWVDTVNDHEGFAFDFEFGIEDWTYDNNSIAIQAHGDFEFSLDGIHYQDQPYFENLANGEYQIFVRDKSDCGVVVKDANLLMYPKYFTPNADGYHDFWNIIGATTDPNMKVSVYDRYGKFITSFFGKDPGWDGNYNGQPFPSNDYWFVVSRSNGKNYKGHFTLKR